jgi:sugar lactone lactonase YvrE
VGTAVFAVVAGTILADASPSSARARRHVVAVSITTVAGGGATTAFADGAASRSAALGSPLSAVFDAHGNVVFADQNNNVICVEAASTGFWYGQAMTAGHIYTVVGTAAGLFDPNGVAVDARGDLAITDTGNNTVDFVPATSGNYYGIAGMTAGQMYPIANGVSNTIVDGGFAYSAGLNSPDGIAFDAQGDVVVADTGNNVVRLIPATNHTVFGQAVHTQDIYTIAGNTNDGYSGDGGPGYAAALSLQPFAGVAVDGSGNVVIADAGNSVVRVVAAVSGVFHQRAMTAGDIYTIAGNGIPGYKNNKKATRGEMDTPQGVTVDSSGNILVSDAVNNDIRLIPARSGKYLGTRVKANGMYNIAGNGKTGYAGDGGSPKTAELNGPAGLSVDPFGQVIVADNGNDVIREITG